MPTIQAPSARPLVLSAAQTKPKTSLAKQTQEAVKASSLSTTDSYIRNSNQWDVFLFEGYNSYRSAQLAIQQQSEGLEQWVDPRNIGSAVKRGTLMRTVTSSARNGWDVYKGRISMAQAGGRVIGDVSTAAVGSAVGSVVSQVAVQGISKISGNPLVVKFGSMAVGWGANYATRKVLAKTGVQQAITNKTTSLLQKIGN